MSNATATAVEECSMTLLNSLGDVTIVWTKDKDAEVKDMIREKLKKGVSFFILKKIPVVPLYRRSAIGDPNELKDRRVNLKDEHLDKLVANGTVTLAKTGDTTMEFVRATRDVDEIANSNTAAMPAMAGG